MVVSSSYCGGRRWIITVQQNKDLSTSQLATELKLTSTAMFQQLAEVGLINMNRELTTAGLSKGDNIAAYNRRETHQIYPVASINYN